MTNVGCEKDIERDKDKRTVSHPRRGDTSLADAKWVGEHLLVHNVISTMIFRLLLVSLPWFHVFGFPVTPLFAATAATAQLTEPTLKDVATKVAVTGATGRTGRLVVEELLAREVGVVAMVRDLEKAKEVFPDPLPNGLDVLECDLTSEEKVTQGTNAEKLLPTLEVVYLTFHHSCWRL